MRCQQKIGGPWECEHGGRICGATSDFLDGLIDDVRIYNRALSPDEIKRLYQSGATTHINISLPGPTKGLAGWWTFDEKDMAGVHAYDKSGQGNGGTLTSGPRRMKGKVGQALQLDGGMIM